MTLQELRFIIALANTKHFGKAATLTHVSQPTLSIAIRKLEEELGITLFERNKNQIHLTPVAEQIVDKAKNILAEVDGIKQLAKANGDPLSGSFKLGIIYTAGPYLLPSLITKITKKIPHMTLEIQENFTSRLREKLIRGELDAAILSLPFAVTGITTKVLYNEPFVVLMPYDHPLAKFKAIKEDKLNKHPVLLLGEEHCFRQQVISSCPSCFVPSETSIPWRTVEGTSLETIKHMVAAKLGLTILPKSAAQMGPYPNTVLTTRPLQGAQPKRAIVLAWRKNYPRIQAISAIIEAVSAANL